MINKNMTQCQFNMDTGCVEIAYDDGSVEKINCTDVENQYADNRFERSALDYLIYSDPAAYADLVMHGDVESYLKNNTDYTKMD